VNALAKLPVDEIENLGEKTADAYPSKPLDGVDDDAGNQLAARGLAVMLDVATRDGHDEMIEEVRAAFPEISDEAMGAIASATVPTKGPKEITEAVDIRDSLSQCLTRAILTIDYRDTGDDSNGQARLLPALSAHIGVDGPDEHDANSFTFQMSPYTLE